MKNSIWKWAAGILVAVALGLGGVIWDNLEGRVQKVETKQQLTDADIALTRASNQLIQLEKRKACGRQSDEYETCERLKRTIKRLEGQIQTLESK